MMNAKHIIEDEVFENLHSCFLATGRGRRKDLKKNIPLTNKLLVQLAYLREEGQKQWTVIDTWLAQISPEVKECVTCATYFHNIVKRTVKQFQELFLLSQHDAFLLQPVDLTLISEELYSLGVSCSNFCSPPSEPLPTPIKITNNVVVQMEHYRQTQGLVKKYSLMWICHWTGVCFKKLPYAINCTMKLYSQFKRKSEAPGLLENFLSEQFQLPSRHMKVPSATPFTFSPSPRPSSPLPPSAAQNKCEQCAEWMVEKRALKDLLSSTQRQRDDLIHDLEVTQTALHSLKAHVPTKEKILRARIRSLLSNNVLRYRKFKRLYVENKCLEDSMTKSKRRVKELKGENVKLRGEVETLNARLDERVETNVKLKESRKNAYTNEVRKAVIALQCDAGVSAANVKKVFEIVGQHIFRYKFTNDLPCMQTALNMVDEGLVVSNIQVADAILSSSFNNLTLHCDGTSRDTKKILGHQLSFDKNVLYLGYNPVACEDANTVLDLTLSVLKNVANNYEGLSSHSPNDLVKLMFSKITSTMTDRAAVMKSFCKKFEQYLSTELGGDMKLNILHCMAHFLLGLSSSLEKALSSVESQLDSLGRDVYGKFSRFKSTSESATVRIIRTTCDVFGPRGDAKNGCRVDWTTYCSTKSYIPSFKSNRFNCFFEAAASLVFHREQIVSFFDSGILPENINLKLESVSHDIKDDRLMSLVCVVALFYLKVSGPYWCLINSNIISYGDLHVYIKQMHSSFKYWGVNPYQIFDSNFLSVFGNDTSININSSPFWDSVHDFVLNQHDQSLILLIENVVRSLAKDAVVVTERQLNEFLEGDFDERYDMLLDCPLTNLIGESAFGDFDFDLSKRRNASLHNRSAHHCVRRNKTVKYLEGKSEQQQIRIFQKARRQGSVLRQKSRDTEEKVKVDIRQKFITNQQKKIDKTLAEKSRNDKIVNAVKEHGGPCLTLNDVNDFVLSLENKSQKEKLNVLKNELRYQKHVCGHKLKFGTIAFMIDALKNCFSVPNPPSKKSRT